MNKLFALGVLLFGLGCGDADGTGASGGANGSAGAGGSAGATSCQFGIDEDPSAGPSCEFPCDGVADDFNKPGVCTLVCTEDSQECPVGTECAIATFSSLVVCLPPCADGCAEGLTCDTENYIDHCVPWI